MNSQSQIQSKKLLSSWKEIASCLNRGVRTVQRWEHEGLPIRRPAGAKTNVVLAVESDLHEWVAKWQKKESTSCASCEVEQYEMRLAVVKQQIEQIGIRLRGLEQCLGDLRPASTKSDASSQVTPQAALGDESRLRLPRAS